MKAGQMAQQGKTLAASLDDLSSIPGHVVQEENWLPQVVL